MEVVKPSIVKSKQSRFPLIEATSGVVTSRINDPLYYGHSYRIKQILNPKLPKILVHGAGSAAMAAVENGWYKKTGCCASISQSGSNTRIVYYVPHVGPMSIKKKIAYIKELERLFPRKLRYLGISEGPIAKHPLGYNDGREERIQLGGADEVAGYPRSFIAAPKYLMVYGKVSTSNAIDRLLLLQFLRPLYQTITCNANVSGVMNYGFEYYQPRLYMRLKKWFPKLTIQQLMYLSFTIHGYAINQTYFAYHYYGNGYAPSFDAGRNFSSINLLVGQTSRTMKPVLVDTAMIQNILADKFDVSSLGNSPHINNAQTALMLLFVKGTKHSLTQAIKLIAYQLGDKSLTQNI